jgi:ribose transport system substrate-binding protein
MAAKSAGIPVILLDRNVDQNLAQAGKDYVTFIGSDFVEQGRRAAEALTRTMNGNAKILQLEGFPGSSPAINRRKGFEDAIKAYPGMRIIASQPGDFERAKGRQVAEALLQRIQMRTPSMPTMMRWRLARLRRWRRRARSPTRT